MDYRLYFFGTDGHIESFVVLDSETDEAALSLACTLADGRMMELWDRGRVVEAFPGGRPAPNDTSNEVVAASPAPGARS